MVKNILLLGDSKLYQVSKLVKKSELSEVRKIANDLFDTMEEFRQKHGFGRGIAAPQINVFKRIICLKTDSLHEVLINPIISFETDELFEVLDDCMSFPNLYVKVKRYKKCSVKYKDLDWKDCKLDFELDLAELLQHEYDHLDGILATMRAIDNKSLQVFK